MSARHSTAVRTLSRPAATLALIAALGAALLTQLALPRAAAAASFASGDRVAVATDALNVRSGPGLNQAVINVVTWGMVGTVTAGPTSANGYTWYAVTFDAGSAGWVAGDFLTDADEDPGTGFPIGTRVTVATDLLNVRSAAGLSAPVVNTLPAGYVAFIADGPVAASGYTWYRIDAMGVALGWVAGEFLAVDDLFARGDEVLVATDRLNLRSWPGLDAGVIDVLSYGTRATVMGLPANPTDDGILWVDVETEDGQRGWVAGSYLSRV